MNSQKSRSGFLSDPQNSVKILKMTADTMFLILKDGTCVDLDVHTDRWFLQDAKWFIGKNIFEVLPSETSIALKNNFNKVVLTGISSTDNYEIQLGKTNYYFKCIMYNFDEKHVLFQYRDITQRIKLKQNLEKANLQLQAIQKVALIGHWIYNTATEFFEYNGFFGLFSSGLDYTKISKSELLDLIHEEDRYKFEEYILESNDSKYGDLKYYRVKNNGKTFYLRFKTINRYFEDGVHILEGYIQNITDIKENQHKLEMVTQAVSNSTDYIFAMKTDGNIVFGNQRFKEIQGWSSDEDIISYNIKDSKTSWMSYKGWMEIIHQVTSSQQMVSFVINRTIPEKQLTQSFDCTSYLFKDSLGTDLVWTFGKNITERVHYEKQVKELNQIMSTVLSNIPMFISVKDVTNDLRYIFSNKSGGDFRSGLSGQIIGKTDFEIFPKEIAETMRNDDMETMQNSGETKKTFEDTDEKGETRITEQLRILIQDEIRPLLLTIEKDITLSKQMEQDLVVAKEKAEQSDKLKSAFIANISHEIRTPLNAIVGFSRIMAETPDDEERRTYYSIVEDNNERLLVLVNEILDLSKIESGIMEFERAPLKMNEFGEDIINTMSLKCPKGVELIYEPSDKNLIIFCDRNRLFQVFVNLISNAIKFTYKGSIRFGYNRTPGYVDFYVKDTGKGISAEKLDKVFERFVKADNFTQGTGLGLSICKSIVERMGGEISVSSQIGEGTCFTFRIPEYNVLKNSSESSVSFTQSNCDVPEDCTVLVAEDTDSNYKLIEAMIGRSYKLIRAVNGVEAVALCSELQPDLVLMDIKMPEMNGLDATQIIRRSFPDIPIIIQSAYAFEDDRKKAMECGSTDFIAKPFTKKQLTEIIQKSFKNSSNPETDHE
jgi:signal transduction histidine kinase/CheY-like chemotaxis protein